MVSKRAGRWLAVAATCLVVGAVVVLGGVGRPAVAAQDMAMQQDSDSTWGTVQECPHDWKFIYQRSRDKRTPGTVAVTAATGFAGVGRITDVPEFHDCQRFRLNATAYGPLVAIFAAWELDSLDIHAARDAGFQPPAPPADLVAPLPQTPGRPQVTPSIAGTRPAPISQPRSGRGVPGPGATVLPGGRGSGMAARRIGALILNLGQEYRVDNFVIRPGYNCLYMWLAPTWQARIVPVPTDSACLKPILPDTFSTGTGNLKVIPDWSGGTRDDYPPVARWDYDETNRQYYIGVKCGLAWCEIGGANFSPNPPYRGPFPAEVARVRRIKGWYDEQLLAVPGPSGTLVPSRLKGTLIPHPALGRYTATDFDGKWSVAAYVALDGGSPQEFDHYMNKYNLTRAAVGDPVERLNRIELCQGTRGKCGISFWEKPTCGGLNFIGMGQVRWWARVTSPASPKPRVHCVARIDHTSVGRHIPGTARWRWIIGDETSWTRCIEGCCEMDNNSAQ